MRQILLYYGFALIAYSVSLLIHEWRIRQLEKKMLESCRGDIQTRG